MTSKTNKIAQWPREITKDDEHVKMILIGDTNIQNRTNPADAFKHVMPALHSADLLFGQLESPLSPPSTDPKKPDIQHKYLWHHSHPEMVKGLEAAGFAAVSCASNVTYGSQTILNSLSTLDTAKIGHCGAGRNLEEARRPAIVERGGVQFGFLSYTSVFWPVGHAAGTDTPGVATIKATTAYQPGPRALEMPGVPPLVVTTPDPTELEAMKNDVRRLREEADIVVASCHWGVSGSSVVADYQRAIGHAAIEAGADIVIGHHPHVLQEIEIWQDRPIFYSMGNFVFDWERMRNKNLDGLIVYCTIRDRHLVDIAFAPVRRNNDNFIELLQANRDEGGKIVDHVCNLSSKVNTEITVENEVAVIKGLEVSTA